LHFSFRQPRPSSHVPSNTNSEDTKHGISTTGPFVVKPEVMNVLSDIQTSLVIWMRVFGDVRTSQAPEELLSREHRDHGHFSQTWDTSIRTQMVRTGLDAKRDITNAHLGTLAYEN